MFWIPGPGATLLKCSLELQKNLHEYFTMMKKFPTRINACLSKFHNSVLNVKALLGAFNQEKALVGAISVIVKSSGAFR